MNRTIFFLLFLGLFSISNDGRAQICGGNLGENIFTDGDFGSGTANMPASNPMIAPGYIYTTNPPPSDGYYTLSNNLAAWPGLYSAWLGIGDNSTDPFGYMMVINASFQPGLFYEQEVDGLCDNTLYVFTADVINLIKTGTPNHIDPNVSFLIDGVEFFTTGNIPKNQQWQTYGFTFTTNPGQSSVVLSLKNNAPGGNGNDLALDNIEFRPCGPEALILPVEIENICEDGSPIDLDATVVGDQYDTPAFQWQQSFDEGLTWVDIAGANSPVYTHSQLSSGYYYYRYLLANGPGNLSNSKCRVVSNVKIVYVVPKFYEIRDTLCEGLSFTLNGHNYTQTGVYVDSLVSSIGCDSILTLDLTIVPDPGVAAEVVVQNPGCIQTTDGSLLIQNVLNGVSPFSYYFQGAPTGLTFFESLIAGSYTIGIEDRYGCFYEEEFNLQPPTEFFVDAGNDVFVELGELVTIHPVTNTGLESFYWSPDPMMCDPECWDLAWYPKASTDLVLHAVSEDGCVASDTVHVGVIGNRKVYIPNVFSPNADGVNDYFAVFGPEPHLQSVQKMMVFDRWGSLVFEQKDFAPNRESSGWDGRVNGDTAPVGVYTYLVEIRFYDDRVLEYSGDVMLVK